MERSLFESSDMGLAAVLQVLGYTYVSARAVDRTRVMFSYLNTPELESTVDAYFQKKLMMEPFELLSAVRTVKSKIFSVKENDIKY